MAEELQAVKPERFGRYILLDRIGVGGMAEVFRAVMPGPDGFKRMFVVKRILAPLCQNATFVEMFVREAHIGALLNHPNIAQVYDFGNVDGEYFLAMEYVRGSDLLALMRRLREAKQRFPIPIAAFIAHQVAGCLAYAHALCGPDGGALHIIHRDVTPSNIMCLRTGGVKLLDFGIAKSVAEAGIETTEQGSFKGKLAYMAPECIRDEPFDARSDLYSLGVVLWEMLTGRRLFRGANDLETFKNGLELTVAPPSSLRPGVPASLDAVVLRALARSPADRYATGQAMADDLEPILAETGFQSRMISTLLTDLYGSVTHSSQVALACLTPELLAAARGEGPADLRGSSAIIAAVPSAPSSESATEPAAVSTRRTGTRRVWAALLATTAVAAIVLVLGARGGAGRSHAATTAASTARPRPSVVEYVTAPTPAPTAATADSAPRSAPSPPVREAPARRAIMAKARPAIASRRPAAAGAGVASDAIASGRSIDPFAEAARRGHR